MKDISVLSVEVGEALSERGLMLATAESCTGGWVAQAVTSVAGSSRWFERGFVTYTNIAKQDMLGVAPALLARAGAVSEEVVRAMSKGCLQHSRAAISLAISGIAGPGGGTKDKPVGLVWFAWGKTIPADALKLVSARQIFSGDRDAVRRQAVACALQGVLSLLNESA